MRQEESVGRNARCVSIIEKEEGKKGAERKEERKESVCGRTRSEGERRRLDNRRMPKPRAKADRRQVQVCATIYGKYRRHTAVLTCHHIDIVIICKCAYPRRWDTYAAIRCCSGSSEARARACKGDHRELSSRKKICAANRLSFSSVMRAAYFVF